MRYIIKYRLVYSNGKVDELTKGLYYKDVVDYYRIYDNIVVSSMCIECPLVVITEICTIRYTLEKDEIKKYNVEDYKKMFDKINKT